MVLARSAECDLSLDYLDLFRKTAFGASNRSWDKVLLKPTHPGLGGGSGASRRKAEEKAAQELEAEFEQDFLKDDKVEDLPPPPKSVVRLSAPGWMGERGVFNGKIAVSVEGELPPESSHLTRVSFTVYALLPGGTTERIDAQEGHIRNGKASADMTLWIPNYRDADGKTLAECEYVFKAKHVQSKEIESEPIKAGTEGANTDTSSFYLRIHMDPEAARKLEEKFILESADGSFSQTRTADDDLIPEDDYIDLRFTEVPTGASFSLKIETQSTPAYFVFRDVPFAKLDGFTEG
jgi:hypothetical protein